MALQEQIPLNINISFRIIEATCSSFSFTEYAKKNSKEIDNKSYEFDFKVQQTLDPIKKNIGVIFITTLFEKQGAAKLSLAEMNSKLVFALENFDDIVKKQENHFHVPLPLLSLTSGLVLSTVRGMFVIKLENTIYSNAIVPAVDPNIFLPQQPMMA